MFSGWRVKWGRSCGTVIWVCPTLLSSLALTPLSPLSSLPDRTWRKLEKVSGRVLSVCGPGSSPGLAWLPDPPPVLLVQFIETQPESTIRLQSSTALEFRRAFSGGGLLKAPTPNASQKDTGEAGKEKLLNCSWILAVPHRWLLKSKVFLSRSSSDDVFITFLIPGIMHIIYYDLSDGVVCCSSCYWTSIKFLRGNRRP